MNSQPTAAQKLWREAVRSLGSVISGEPAVIHHPVGRTAKHNKVHIGHWWVIPLTDEEHKALHNGETFGHRTRKDFEKDAFQNVYRRLLEQTRPQSRPPPEAHRAIVSYHR